jgi:hypothetical protein
MEKITLLCVRVLVCGFSLLRSGFISKVVGFVVDKVAEVEFAL